MGKEGVYKESGQIYLGQFKNGAHGKNQNQKMVRFMLEVLRMGRHGYGESVNKKSKFHTKVNG